MTKEERNKHNQELCSHLASDLLQKDISKEYQYLSIQEMLVIYENARQLLDKEIFVSDKDKEDKLKDAVVKLYCMILDEIINADKLYLIIDRTTRMPYLDDENNCYVFSEQDYAMEILDHFAQQLRSWEMEPVMRIDIIRTLGQTFYEDGAEGVVIDNGQYYVRIPAGDLITPPDYSMLPENKKPLVNPDCVRALAKYVQETSWRKTYDEKQDKFNRYEEDMIREFCKASFVVPVLENPVAEESENTFRVPSVTNEKGEHAFPVFTDFRRLREMYPQDEMEGKLCTARSLMETPDDMVVVNAGSIGFSIRKEMIRKMFSIYEYVILPADTVRELLMGQTYYIPFLFEGEEELSEPDNTVHYTPETIMYAEAVQQGKPYEKTEGDMQFRKVKIQETGKEYLPLFSDIGMLRDTFQFADRICMVGKNTVQDLVGETDGLLFDMNMALEKEYLKEQGLLGKENPASD